MAFRPYPVEPWLALFNRTIHKLWQLQPGDVPAERGMSFEVPFLSIVCAYHVERPDGYNSSLRSTGRRSGLLFTLHHDPAYASKAALHNEIRVYEPQNYARYLQDDVARVLDGMVFHPRTHTHVEEHGLILNAATPQTLLALHEIRIGSGLENAFIFLFHLRYQFCLVSEEARGSERTRLVNLFTTAIGARETHVPAKTLFDFRA
ncbi:MAG: hypothetical protein ACLQVX_23460 [Limisphaerales bacterium]